jgi:hypothetical protein
LPDSNGATSIELNSSDGRHAIVSQIRKAANRSSTVPHPVELFCTRARHIIEPELRVRGSGQCCRVKPLVACCGRQRTHRLAVDLFLRSSRRRLDRPRSRVCPHDRRQNCHLRRWQRIGNLSGDRDEFQSDQQRRCCGGHVDTICNEQCNGSGCDRQPCRIFD